MSAAPALRELQQWMKSRIAPRAAVHGTQLPEPLLNPQGGVDGVERLSVYAEGYVERTRQALEEVYEAIRHLLGARRFAQLSRAYAETVPSRTYNLSRRGEALPEFLAGHPLTREFPFLPDLARLEWRVNQAFHAAEQPPMDSTRLSAFSLDAWQRMRLIFQPSVSLVASDWPILDLWDARTRPVAEVSLELIDRPQRVLVFRAGVQVRCELLGDPPFHLMDALLSGRSLGEACEALAARAAQAGHEPPSPTDWFARWVRDGLLIGCEPAAGRP